MITALTRTGPPLEGLIICAPPQIPHAPAPHRSSWLSRCSSRSSRTSAVIAISAGHSSILDRQAVNHPCHQDSHNSRPGSQSTILAPLNRQERRLISTTTPRPAATSATAEPAALLTASEPIILGPVQQLLPKIYYQIITHALPHIAHVCSKIIVMSPERAFNHRII